MVPITLYQWKQFIEGGYRSHRQDYIQQNRIDGDLSIREYKSIQGDMVVAQMITNEVTGEQTFEALQDLVDQTSWIYIPTDEEYEEWSEQGLFIPDEIAKRETPPT